MLSEAILTAVLVGAVAVGASAALIAWRERPEPGATPLAAMLVCECWWSAFLVFELQATSLAGKLLWSNVQWVGVVFIPVAWLLFTLAYTGRDRYVRPRYVAALSVVPVVTLALAATGQYHDLLYAGSRLVEERGMTVLHRRPGPWYWVVTGYTYLLGVLGAVPLVALANSDALLFRGQSAALLVGVVAPWASNALFVAGFVSVSGLDPTPVFFTVSGVAFLGAMTRFRLLGTSPTPNHRARRRVFMNMEAPVVVVDSHEYVVDLNESATRVLGVDRSAALGERAAEIVPGFERLPSTGSPDDHLEIGVDGSDRRYDVAVTPIDDHRGRTVGRALTFTDVTRQLRRQQRLKVLNRSLRHNVRTTTNVIYGQAEAISTDDDRKVEVIQERAMEVAEIAEKAREIIDIFERGRGSEAPVRLALVVREAIESTRREHPDVTVEWAPIPDDVYVSSILAPVVANVVENAAEHNTAADPRVSVDVDLDRDREAVTVAVTDNGPGIGEHELDVLEARDETPLQHGTGLGLWLITWGTEIAGGEVAFEEADPTGTVVRVTVPVLST